MLGKILVPMDSIVVNIGKVDSKRYLRVIISLEVKNSEIEGLLLRQIRLFSEINWCLSFPQRVWMR